MQILYTLHARMTFLMSLVKLRQVLIILCYVFYNATVFPYNKILQVALYGDANNFRPYTFNRPI